MIRQTKILGKVGGGEGVQGPIKAGAPPIALDDPKAGASRGMNPRVTNVGR